MNKSYILSNNKNGFRKGRSTAMVLMPIIDEKSTFLDNKELTAGCFVDLKKHLIQKIIKYVHKKCISISSDAKYFFHRYLSNRTTN